MLYLQLRERLLQVRSAQVPAGVTEKPQRVQNRLVPGYRRASFQMGHHAPPQPHVAAVAALVTSKRTVYSQDCANLFQDPKRQVFQHVTKPMRLARQNYALDCNPETVYPSHTELRRMGLPLASH